MGQSPSLGPELHDGTFLRSHLSAQSLGGQADSLELIVHKGVGEGVVCAAMEGAPGLLAVIGGKDGILSARQVHIEPTVKIWYTLRKTLASWKLRHHEYEGNIIMEAQLLLQEHILALLQEDRERGTELLLETYTPLLWSVCQRRLSDPEDVKECVNDVFSTFCLNPQKFDPEQSSLKNYLAMLADRKAISCYRSNQRRIEAEAAVAHTAQPEQEQTHHSLEEALS